ncbi:MAG: carbamoyl phosphate synthase large subunit [Nitrospirae bacterium GWC2_46_6]|nr:MAG: carbamoyl phosphate synthase large subunit [Nitrospirae bacterium GWC2_46_6]OGW19874.1 MAG: carbamoyl phosphate synthase large subunit [Nitrospirae bacterium GWA2_46_11]OGW23316.1 MAG: carbamoyl phosphate synthase large subunit [Nitrospirae bacterium GWB2_47_37]HAK88820.1 carbamoyl phosphate synthase large subunit [Nitrospiraceae bacterium]HCL81216.1 carbamoyl phosphate synthase large subunit [Nitrospiraceae bacterium]
MPKRKDIKKILLIGSGPIVIGQACEFDYSGTQACKALREEGYKVVLVNSNPATIMTDPEIADATYIEPLSVEILELIIKKEKPDAILPTMGGQTALNLVVELSEAGILDKHGVELIGAKLLAIKKAEDRELFKEAMRKIGLEVPKSAAITDMKDGLEIVEHIGFPAILRPAFTLGGTGGGIAYNFEEYRELLEKGLKLSPVGQVLVEESAIGWKEYELEVMRDMKDNVVIICSIENFDAMGVHTGDSITVAPAQTLTDKEYQRMRDAAIAVIREIGVDTGGSNIQFAVNPKNGKMVVIEMNPRVSRSSALASKATGFPIAKIAAKLAVGYALDEIKNDITRETPASFEPTIDYVVTKIPRFAFEKFPEADAALTTQMKSVGEAMSIGRTFKESLQKALRSLEIGSAGLEPVEANIDAIKSKLKTPNAERIWYVAQALRQGMGVDEIYEITWIDPWFLNNMKQIVEMEKRIGSGVEELREAKEYGFSDKRIAELTGKTEAEIRKLRRELCIKPVYKLVDTCAAEFEAYTPYLYSTYEKPFYKLNNPNLPPFKVRGGEEGVIDCEANPTDKKKVIILGSGPNRIGQGIEFDYCCVHAVFALKELGYETIMINCNPETVSTDYDTADRLYFEPLTIEDVLGIIELERPEGVIVQFGGQTPLKLAVPLEKEGVKILGTSPDSIDRAEDRKRFKELLHKLDLKQPESGTAMSIEDAVGAADKIGYPVMVRPSYVLGGRAMEIVYDEASLINYMERAVKASPEHPILVDKYLEDAIEVDVDAISDGAEVVIGGVMQHIEEAGVHSGDSACSIPPYSLHPDIVDEIKRQSKALAKELNVIGLMNVQFAVKDKEVFILEVNPRASRTIPYVSKATGVSLAKLAAKTMVGKTLKELGLDKEKEIKHVAVKEAVFPFDRFPGTDVILGPEMKSTGEVMGIDENFGLAYAKAQAASKNKIPTSGRIFISVKDKDKPYTAEIAKKLLNLNFQISATRGTAKYLADNGIAVDVINKVAEGRPHIVDMIKNREVNFIMNTVTGAQAQKDSLSIRRNALQYNIPYTTTVSGANAVVGAIEMLLKKELSIKSIQEYNG